jgi:hypothetical protein
MYHGGTNLPVIIVKGYALPQDILLMKELILLAKEAAEKIFGENGICPIEPNEISIIPGFTEPISIRLALTVKPTVEIYLYQKEERTPELLNQIQIEFEKAMNGCFSVVINSQPAELFITI